MGKLIISSCGTGGIDPDVLTAVPSDVLSGKTAGVSGSDEPVMGTMVNNGETANKALNCGTSFTVKKGYHAKAFTVTANSLASQTSGATAADNKVLQSFTYWKDGVRRTGNMPNRGNVSSALNCGGSYTVAAGYHNGGGKITANSLASQTSATASAGRILSGWTGWVNGVKVTGNISSLGGQTITPTKSQQTIACANKYMNGNVVVNAIPNTYLSLVDGVVVFSNGSYGQMPNHLGVNTYKPRTGAIGGYGPGILGKTLYVETYDIYPNAIIMMKSVDISHISRIYLRGYGGESHDEGSGGNCSVGVWALPTNKKNPIRLASMSLGNDMKDREKIINVKQRVIGQHFIYVSFSGDTASSNNTYYHYLKDCILYGD